MHSMNHYEKATEHLTAADQARRDLTKLYRDPMRDPRMVAAVNARLGDSLKLAEVHAQLAAVEVLEGLASDVAAWRLSL